MTRALVPVDAGDPARVLAALRDALTGDGPAILPHDGSAPLDPVAEVPKRVALVIETSGSTGAAKRVALSSNAVLSSAAASDTALGGPGQWLLALPAHYIAGVNVLVRSLTADTSPVILPAGHFDAAGFVAAANRMDAPVRFTSLVPAQLSRLVQAGEESRSVRDTLRGFHRILVGGQATPPALLERAVTLGLNVTRTYGSSETCGGCVYDGIPIGTTVARVRDGQIELSGPMLADGYLGDADRTARNFVPDDGHRWYRTGDAGALVDGVLRVTGRLDRVIISGGVKVALDEVERVVRTIDGLSDAVVLSIGSAEWGEVPVVVTTVPVDLETLRELVGTTLGRPAAPQEVVLVESIPLLASGKPDRMTLLGHVRRALRDRA